MEIYRQEHPNPQWERTNWRNLNGEWEFDFDFGKSARERKLFQKGALSKKINVPFCPESELSGIGYKDFIAAVCYRKLITLNANDIKNNIFLHFGAVDFESFIYINGEQAGHHIGGYSSFNVDITKFVKDGENEIFVIAEDDLRSNMQPCGKQSEKANSYGCFYTRTTGIWQTVWLEFVPKAYIKSAKFYPDINNSAITITGKVCGNGEVSAVSTFEGKETGKASVKTTGGNFTLTISLCELHLWELGCGRLYDLELKFGEDSVKSYFGMRNVSLENKKFMLNNKCVFQRTVLDQGFYPDGIYTAKTDEILENDIKLSMAAGFNGARLHQKIFEARFLYHCDKAGYMVWSEHGNWGMDYQSAVACENFINEWLEAMERDFNHPSIIGWCPNNETWGYAEINLPHRFVETVYRLTKQLDPTRLCVDTSGNYHCDEIEIYDVHDYERYPHNFKENYAHIPEGIIIDQVERADHGKTQKYKGEAVFVSEYGGIGWNPHKELTKDPSQDSWGYGDAPRTEEEFIARFKGLTDVLLDNPNILGLCYTQLYDVEQEQNGLYTYEREPKFDMKIFKEILTRKAKIEE